MYFDYEWVKHYLETAPSLEEAVSLLNSTGLETEPKDKGFEMEHTVNRSDAMGHYGVARELAVKANLVLREPELFTGSLPALQGWTILSDCPQDAPQYTGLLVEGVVACESPAWLKARLEAIDQTSHNLLVDLTNFLLWEFSQPTHAFDADKLHGQTIRVRFGQKGERLRTLDGREHEVADLLCITDDHVPIALGGVMGGKDSEVDEHTTRLLLELAVFRGATVRRTGKAVNIHSDARHRYERGVDRQNIERVIRRFLFLLLREQPAVKIIGFQNLDLQPFERAKISMRRSRLDQLLGIEVPTEEVTALLTRMGFDPQQTATGWDLLAPGYKVDVLREVDVIEEIIRFVGLEKLDSTLPAFGGSDYHPDRLWQRSEAMRDVLKSIGLQEAICFSFIAETTDSLMNPGQAPVQVRNPMTRNQGVMRRHVLPGLLESVRYNTNRGQANLALFELGHVFAPDQEPHHLAVALLGSKDQQHWWGETQAHPFYRIKGVYETLVTRLGLNQLALRNQVPSWLKEGEALGIFLGETCLGGFGKPADSLEKGFDLDPMTMVLEMDLSFLNEVGARTPDSSRLAEFPGMKIDLAFVLARTVSYQEVLGHIQTLSLTNLESIALFDVYEGKSLEKGTKSLGFRFRFRAAERTLTSDEVNATMEHVRSSVCERFGATIRI